MDAEKKMRLLQFSTGTSRIPVNGFKDLHGTLRFSVARLGAQTETLMGVRLGPLRCLSGGWRTHARAQGATALASSALSAVRMSTSCRWRIPGTVRGCAVARGRFLKL